MEGQRFQDWECGLVVDHMIRQFEILGSIPSTNKTNQTQKIICVHIYVHIYKYTP